MHPELLNNPTFIRYYGRWQSNPASAAFVGVADFLRKYHLYDDALKVCEAGLAHNPELVSGRFVLAQIYVEQGMPEKAAEQLQWIVSRQPRHQDALRLLTAIGAEAPIAAPPVPAVPAVEPTWATVTMARLYEQQGHIDQAAMIYRTILSREPENYEAQEGLKSLAKP